MPETQTDKQFIQSPNDWPYWPLLPMRKRDNGKYYPHRIGVIAETDEEKKFSTIYLDVNVWHPVNLAKAEKQVYVTVDEMLADGWECD